MSRLDALLEWLERASDWLSPIVVKEVRQLTRGREFYASFGVSLVIGLAVASFGAADAADGHGTSGGWTFSALMVCLGVVGLGGAPLGAFNALRNERMEQTLDLITLTALSPRRVVIGKLLAQGVRLVTLFAGLAPFVAMSFLLGGIDFLTIVLAMAILFMWSLWACAACLFLSTLFKTRAMSGMLFGVIGLVLMLAIAVFGGGRIVYFFMMGGFFHATVGSGGPLSWWALATMTTFCLASMANLVLLAEHRLSLPSENRVTPLRVGFLAQFLLLVAWALSFVNETQNERFEAAGALAIFGGIHLAIVALFAVTEDLVLPRRVRLAMQRRPAWQRPFAMFLPGGGRGAAYVLTQMALLVVAVWLLDSIPDHVSLVLVVCGYTCFYTGVPAAVLRWMRPSAAVSFLVRFVVIGLLPIALLLPDIVVYMWEPSAYDDSFSTRHLLNPIRILAQWPYVGRLYGLTVPVAAGLIGLLAYVMLFFLGMRVTARRVSIDPQKTAASAGASRGADIVY